MAQDILFSALWDFNNMTTSVRYKIMSMRQLNIKSLVLRKYSLTY